MAHELPVRELSTLEKFLASRIEITLVLGDSARAAGDLHAASLHYGRASLLQDILGEICGRLTVARLSREPAGSKISVHGNKINVLGDDAPGSRLSLADALARAVAAARDSGRVTWLDRDGAVVAAIIPAQDVHEPGTCCCKNCPWQGNHGTGENT